MVNAITKREVTRYLWYLQDLQDLYEVLLKAKPSSSSSRMELLYDSGESSSSSLKPHTLIGYGGTTLTTQFGEPRTSPQIPLRRGLLLPSRHGLFLVRFQD